MRLMWLVGLAFLTWTSWYCWHDWYGCYPRNCWMQHCKFFKNWLVRKEPQSNGCNAWNETCRIQLVPTRNPKSCNQSTINTCAKSMRLLLGGERKTGAKERQVPPSKYKININFIYIYNYIYIYIQIIYIYIYNVNALVLWVVLY